MSLHVPAILFLDAATVDYGDISFASLKRLGKFKAFKTTEPGQIRQRLRQTDIVIANKCVLGTDIFSKVGARPSGSTTRKGRRHASPLLQRLRLICIAATGTNNVDLDAAKKRGIAVTNVAGYSTEMVAQSTLALILSLAGNIPEYDRAVHRGHWCRSPIFNHPVYPVTQLKGKTLGIIGYGAIGKRVAKIAKSFGMKILAAKLPGRFYRPAFPKRLPLRNLLRLSDFVSLHTALTPETQKMINRSALRHFKKGAFLINTARGALIDEKALVASLRSHHLGGAALDVLTEEPPRKNSVLLKAPRLLITPHVGWISRETRQRLVEEIAMNIRAFQEGKRRNRVV